MMLALRNWSYLIVRGAFSILFGLAALLFPWQLLTTLVLLFGVYALVDGLLAILYAMRVEQAQRSWALIIEGGLGIAFGVLTCVWPHFTARMLLYVIAAWAILTGLLEIAAMAWLRRVGFSGLLLALSGVCSIALGAALFFVPEAGMVALTWLLGAYASISGGLLCWLGLTFRRMHRDREDGVGSSVGGSRRLAS